jgi:hypothetical protein
MRIATTVEAERFGYQLDESIDYYDHHHDCVGCGAEQHTAVPWARCPLLMVRLPYGGKTSPRVSGASGMMKSPITKTTAVKATGKPSV